MADVPRRDVYLASDGHLYAGSALARYVVHERSLGRLEPKSPLTCQPLTVDVARLFAAATQPAAKPQTRWAKRDLDIGHRVLGNFCNAAAASFGMTMLNPPTVPHRLSVRAAALVSASFAAAMLVQGRRPHAAAGVAAGQAARLVRDACALGAALGVLWLLCANWLAGRDVLGSEELFFYFGLGGICVPLAAYCSKLLDAEAMRQRDLGAPDTFSASLRYFSLDEGDVVDDPRFAAELAGLFAAR